MSIQISGMAPLLSVFDMPTSLHFYCDILGFRLVQSAGPPGDIGWALLAHPGVELMLNTLYELPDRPASPDAVRVSIHRDTCLYFGCADPDEAYEHLCAHGISLDPPAVAPYGMKQLYVLDPDGYNLCFQWPATEEQVNAWRERYGTVADGA